MTSGAGGVLSRSTPEAFRASAARRSDMDDVTVRVRDRRHALAPWLVGGLGDDEHTRFLELRHGGVDSSAYSQSDVDLLCTASSVVPRPSFPPSIANETNCGSPSDGNE
jgi:hypothetical protein